MLLRGPSGAGKSDLALRLIDGGARLVADDQTELVRDGDRILARPPETLAGRIEVRGIGIVEVPYLPSAPVVLVCDLVPPGDVVRLPGPVTTRLQGVELSLLQLTPFEASAAAKLRLAVDAAGRAIVPDGE